MTANLHKVFGYYSQLRDQGSDPKAALDKLREPIMQLKIEDRRELARYINALENGKIQSAQDLLPTQPAPAINTDSIKRLNGLRQRDVTSNLLETSEIFFTYEYFGEKSVLVLQVRGSSEVDRNHHYEIRPQTMQRDLILGRAGEAKQPDIDLLPHGADVRGVSRQHIVLHYERDLKHLTVTDLNSSNGSFINGQRLYANESHVLRNGDELRLGKMVLDIVFQHLDAVARTGSQNNDLPQWLR